MRIFGCGIGKGHSEQYKMAHKGCVCVCVCVVSCRCIGEDKRFDEYFGCGVIKGIPNSTRWFIGSVCILPVNEGGHKIR